MLSSVVDTDCWEAAREAAAEQRKGLTKQQAVAEGVMQSLSAAVERLRLDLQHTQQQEQGWEQQTQAQKVRASCRGMETPWQGGCSLTGVLVWLSGQAEVSP